MHGDVSAMISRQLVIKLLVPFLLLCIVLGGVRSYQAFLSLPSASAPKRSNSAYEERIVESYPATQGTFSVVGATVQKSHWVVVEIKNIANNDKLRVLFYDPLGTAEGLQLIAGPSTATSFDSLMNPAEVPRQEEVKDAAK